MRKRFVNRAISLLLTAVMLLGMGPAAFAEETDETTSDNGFCRIVHLDCGRKYFSVSSIKTLIDSAASAKYNQLQLAFGNDGLRFLLDDMSFTANGTTYESATVKSAVEEGNKTQNSSNDGSYLTETEMKEIISYANANGLEVVPLLNLPGHANAILDIAGDSYNYSGSDNTLDVTNAAGINFATALFQKYVDWFAEQGCKYFNFGADEYGNDIETGSFSFARMGDSEYTSFVTFINSLSSYIKSKGMTPRAFNDGLYFTGLTSSVDIDTDIQCCYWSSGWDTYPVASAATIAANGHDMINTHGDFYYVLKNNNSGNQIVPGDASAFDSTVFMGSTISNPVGAMFCIWCDYPNYNGMTDEQVVADAAGYLTAMGTAMANTEPGSGDSGDDSGENATPVTKNITLYLEDDTLGTVTDTISGHYYTTYEYVDNNTNVVAVEVVGKEESVSSGGSSGGSAEVVTSLTEGAIYIIGDGTHWMKVDGSAIVATENSSEAEQWKMVLQTGVYYLQSSTNAEMYFGIGSSQTSAALANSSSRIPIAVTSEGYLYYDRPIVSDLYFEYDGEWMILTSAFSTCAKLYSASSSGAGSGSGTTEATTEVTFTAQNAGTTTVTVGHVTYNVTVYPKPNSYLPVELWITNGQVTAEGTLSAETTRSGVSYTYYYVNVPDTGANTEDGVDIAGFVPQSGTAVNQNAPVDYWKAVYLPEGTEQSTAPGSDYTLTADSVEKVRYWGGEWQLYIYDYQTDTYEWVDYNEETNQAVAYYLMHTELISEELSIQAHTKDWGFESGKADASNEGYCTVSIQIVFPDGATNPVNNNDALIQHSWVFNYWTDRDLGYYQFDIENDSNYEIYRITDTLGNPTMSGNTISGFTWATETVNNETILDETIVRDVPQGENLGTSVAFYSDSSDGSIAWSDEYKSHLIRVYVRPTTEASEVTVHYIDNMTGVEFYTYGINAREGAVFTEPTPGTSSTGKTILTTTVERNILGPDGESYLTANVTSDLTQMPEIAAQYRYCDPVCTGHTISLDGKSLTFYYDFNPQRIYVLDFGLPVTIQHTEYYTDEIAAAKSYTISKVETYSSGTTRYGSLSADAEGAVTYSPDSAINDIDAYTVIVYYSDVTDSNGVSEDATLAYHLYFVPASNVLYEEGFMTAHNNSGNTLADWAGSGSKLGDSDENQSSKNTAPYGYDTAYSNSDEESGTQYTVELYPSTDKENAQYKMSDKLSFSFFGTGFDLIGACGPATGTLMVRIDKDGSYLKSYIVDTSFSDAAYGKIYQIPIVHFDNSDVNPADYKVTISGAYINYASAASGSLYGLGGFGGSAAIADIYDLMYNMGITDEQIDYVEFINMDKHDGVATYAAGSTYSVTPDIPDSMTLEIDGFRVYRTTTNNFYEESESTFVDGETVTTVYGTEYGISYHNALDAVSGEFAAYIEATPDGSAYTVETYAKKGGPQNEVYLGSGQSLAFAVDGKTAVQVSVRNVSPANGYAKFNNLEITHNTEMYYEVEVGNDGLVAITNNGPEGTLLAICNFKFMENHASTLSASSYEAVFSLLRNGGSEVSGQEIDDDVILDVSVQWMDSRGNQVTSLPKNRVSAVYKMNNLTDSEIAVTLVTAAYDGNGKVLAVQVEAITLAIYGEQTLAATLSLPKDTAEVKAFLVDEDMNPLCSNAYLVANNY